MSDYVEVDDSRWPLVYTKYPSKGSVHEDAVIADFEETLSRIYEAHSPLLFVTLADLRDMNWRATATDRRKLAEMLNRVAEKYAHPLADAVLVRGKLMRLMATGVTFLQGDKGGLRRAFTDPEEAQDWLQQSVAHVPLVLERIRQL